MNFSIENRDGIVIFTLKNKMLDSENSANLKAELLIICQPDIKGLIMDITNVEYIDSSGLGALLLAHRQLKDQETFITLVGAQEVVKLMLDISQLSELFQFSDLVEEAVEYY